MRTRPRLIEKLTLLQMERLENMEREDKSRHNKIYFYYHDNNCKLETKVIKARIARELIWKTWKGGTEYGTTTQA